jgi:hypothetical protein
LGHSVVLWSLVLQSEQNFFGIGGSRLMRGRIERQVVAESERVDDPLMVTEVKTGLARSPQLEGVFIGVSFTGRVMGDDEGEYVGDLVMTVELVEVMIENLRKAIAKAKAERELGGTA